MLFGFLLLTCGCGLIQTPFCKVIIPKNPSNQRHRGPCSVHPGSSCSNHSPTHMDGQKIDDCSSRVAVHLARAHPKTEAKGTKAGWVSYPFPVAGASLILDKWITPSLCELPTDNITKKKKHQPSSLPCYFQAVQGTLHGKANGQASRWAEVPKEHVANRMARHLPQVQGLWAPHWQKHGKLSYYSGTWSSASWSVEDLNDRAMWSPVDKQHARKGTSRSRDLFKAMTTYWNSAQPLATPTPYPKAIKKSTKQWSKSWMFIQL